MTLKELTLVAMAVFCLTGGIAGAIYTLCTDGTVQDAGLCLFIGAACAAWFQNE